MKKKKLGLIILALIIAMSLIACRGEGYNTRNYIGQNLDDQMGRILNISDFRGKKVDQWQFQAGSVIDVEISVEEGKMHFTLSDPEGNVLFEQEVEERRFFRESFEGEFSRGTYSLKLESRKAKNVAIDIRTTK